MLADVSELLQSSMTSKDTKGVCGYSQKRKFDAESLDSRRTCLFDTIRSPCSIVFEPLRFFIFRLRLKQFPELFYSQKFRAPETKSFQALLTRRKVSVNCSLCSQKKIFQKLAEFTSFVSFFK